MYEILIKIDLKVIVVIRLMMSHPTMIRVIQSPKKIDSIHLQTETTETNTHVQTEKYMIKSLEVT